MTELLLAFWHRWAERKAFRVADRSGVCCRCGKRADPGFGLMGGGYGPYVFCTVCPWYAKIRLP